MKNLPAHLTTYILLIISMFFNATVGYSVIAALSIKIMMATAYATLDCCNYQIIKRIPQIKSFFLRQLAKISTALFVALSIFAAYTANIILDSKMDWENYQIELKSINKDIDFQDKEAEKYQHKSDINFRNEMSRYSNQAQDALDKKKELTEERKELTANAPTPPNQVVFQKIVNDFDLNIEPEILQGHVRLLFGLGIGWACLLLPLVISDITSKKKRKSVASRLISRLCKKLLSQSPSIPQDAGLKKPTKTWTTDDQARFESVRNKVLSGMKISYTNVKSEGFGSNKAQEVIKKLEREGIIRKRGKTWELKPNKKDQGGAVLSIVK